jgi:hypothetical protein
LIIGFWIAGVILAAADQLPVEVSAFLERRNQCTHWADEEAYDDQRAAEIDKALKQLRCDNVEAEEADLRRRFAEAQTVLNALSAEPH